MSLIINGVIGVVVTSLIRGIGVEVSKYFKGKRLVSAVRGNYHIVVKSPGDDIVEKQERVIALSLYELRTEGYEVTAADEFRARSIVDSLNSDPNFPDLIKVQKPKDEDAK